ncbi:MAG: hypothetical protein A3C70_03515 [Candidatus Zambryskibacteria bacterium RIFCSPHIGHO2_02_FULL_43_14]|uniref:Plasmid stabilization protein n=1 Tax=Candidatus Zambryskibacteria bacterium RIFCSPHIGHO2_02_FULL_43_14 TaxID=1802748 RepID=A0A1G2TFT4_9BACT|nr:MAG: hypothetical protein A2829_00960 [Candidatus Zambryskibacteria bacterium RIFCSPHIGHO2_01_FULL_43_60]OHA96154.1 MAG: hypothetical protein A3C70_03515 [Candidatus Zambryskibacteria bacterium RIFCSPHIGHO2_02_FULL_43_14]OHB03154.1 MAG: hypothetical protein A3B03_01800 [Candidatus Zambryskibacteria bacterium RIFCSPLOWO2_01_FULL_42_41]
MISVAYTPKFVRQFKKLDDFLQKEVIEKFDLFIKNPNNPSLKIHRLHGKFDDCWAFSIDYRYRAIFKHLSRVEIIMIAIGDHDVYK